MTSYRMSHHLASKRVWLDTSVIGTELRSRLDASNRFLELGAEERRVPLVTTVLFFECEEAPRRPDQRLVTGMDEKAIAGFMVAFASAAEPVEVHFVWRPQFADPDSQIVLEAAVNGRAAAMVAHNAR